MKKLILLIAGMVATIAVMLSVIYFASKDNTADYGDPVLITKCAFRIDNETDECVDLMWVSTPAGRERGLSGRESMPRTEGLLFDFGKTGRYCMWMKDMHFSIDIIWLDESKQITKIERDVTPESYPQRFCNDQEPAQYIIELNAGVAKEADLRLGAELEF